MNVDSIYDAAAHAHYACAVYLEGPAKADWKVVSEALTAFDRAIGATRSAFNALRPQGKLPSDHPWHRELADLGFALKINRMMVNAIANRAAAHHRGELDAYDRRVEQRVDADSKRFARAAADIEAREGRIGMALAPTLRAAIVRAYARRG